MNLNHLTPYDEMAFEKNKKLTLKQLASSIILSAIEDADLEFFENDFAEWKKIKKSRFENMSEAEYEDEFDFKQEWKDVLYQICGLSADCKTIIPNEILKERELFENNSLDELTKITKYKKETLLNMAKSHGWKIGIHYKKLSLFDDILG